MKNHILGNTASSTALSHITALVKRGPHNLRSNPPPPPPAPPHPSTTAPNTSPEGFVQAPSTLLQPLLRPRSGQVHLIGRAWVPCDALAAREAGKVGLGGLSSYSAGWALQLPRLIGRALRHWMTKDKVERPLQEALKAKGTVMQRHRQHVRVLAQSNERPPRSLEYIFSTALCLLNCCLDSLPLHFNVFGLQGQSLFLTGLRTPGGVPSVPERRGGC